MRCFIAIDIDERIQQALDRLQQQLQAKADIRKSDVKWVKPEQMHLTLKFLGEVKDQKIAELCNIVDKVAAKYTPFEVDVAKLGCFGKNAARVLWVGIGEKNDTLLALQKDIDQALTAVGYPSEQRQFAGHLTLCRIRNPKAGRELTRLSSKYEDLQLGSVFVESVCLYQSRLTPTGPVYTLLGNYKLK